MKESPAGVRGLVRLYDYQELGNCYKIRLLLSLLREPFERVHLDILKGQTRTPEFRAKNPNQKVPVVEWPDGRCLAESDAILWYLAEGTPFLPADRWERAQVLQPYIAVVRFWHHAGLVERNRQALAEKMERGYHALGVMEGRLKTRSFFVGDRYTIADIALYAYTHVAAEGGFDLGRFPAVRAWLERAGSQPGHVRITDEVGVLTPWP